MELHDYLNGLEPDALTKARILMEAGKRFVVVQDVYSEWDPQWKELADEFGYRWTKVHDAALFEKREEPR